MGHTTNIIQQNNTPIRKPMVEPHQYAIIGGVYDMSRINKNFPENGCMVLKYSR